MKAFRDIIGHQTIKEHLQQGIRNRQVSHAYIFEGDDGIGKRTTALAFAAALQCHGGGDEPCGSCLSCLQMESGNQPDVTFVTHEKSVIAVGDVRERICAPMSVKPYAGPYRIFIVDEAEKMNDQAQNALLKTLEEPPEYGIIILLTNNRETFLPTILSRAVVLNFLPVPDAELIPYLMREAGIPDYRARLAAVFAGGSPGKALACAVSEEFQNRKDFVTGLMQNLPDMGEERMATVAKNLAAGKEELADILDLMQVWIRDLLCVKAAGRKAEPMFSQEAATLAAQAERISYEGIRKLQEELDLLTAKRKANVTPEPAIWLMLVHMKESFRL
ncbi:MAG: DNA polymerase III subunit delta' [Lachnospiraceae bacterium]|nr:DNA polymerase III subunit delta' [Lachnospiraceae bacterium]